MRINRINEYRNKLYGVNAAVHKLTQIGVAVDASRVQEAKQVMQRQIMNLSLDIVCQDEKGTEAEFDTAIGIIARDGRLRKELLSRLQYITRPAS